jgi:hypothetical protein
MKTKIKVHLMWAVHNLIAHPLGELLYWVGLGKLANRLHDVTIPDVPECCGVRGTAKGFWK